MKMRLTPFWELVRETALQWSAGKTPQRGAALAYYAVFSLGPLLVILVAIAGLAFGQDAVRGELAIQFERLLGRAGADAVDALLAGAAKPRDGFLASVLGVVVLVFGAIGVVASLKDSLNEIWRVEPSKQRRNLWQLVRTYVISLAGVLALGFLLMISLVITAAVAAAGDALLSHSSVYLLEAVNFTASFAILSLMFALMFKWLPDTAVAWRDVWLGAFLTAVLFNCGKFLIGLYLGTRALESTYGAAASLVVVLVWTYYSAQIVFFGAEFTEVYARRFGSRLKGRSSRAT